MTSGRALPPTTIGGLTIDCDDSAAMVAFYVEACGGRPDPEFPRTDCVRVDELLLAFRENPGRVRPTWPGSDMQMHFETFVDDLGRQEARLRALGATRPPEQDEKRPDAHGPARSGRSPVLHLRTPARHPLSTAPTEQGATNAPGGRCPPTPPA